MVDGHEAFAGSLHAAQFYTNGLFAVSHWHEAHQRVQARWHECPLRVVVAAADVVDVRIFEDTPLHAIDVHLADTVGGQVGHLNLQRVLTFAYLII